MDLVAFSISCKSLQDLSHRALYHTLHIDSRTTAHYMHRTLTMKNHTASTYVRAITADVGLMTKTSSRWHAWFYYHASLSLIGVLQASRSLLILSLYLPMEASAWNTSLCTTLSGLRLLHTLNKDVEPSDPVLKNGVGVKEGMDIGWMERKSTTMWGMSELLGPLSTMVSLRSLRLCGISSNSPSPFPSTHRIRLTELVLIQVSITNSDLVSLIGTAATLKKLTLWKSSLLSKRGLSHVRRRCPALVELRIGGSWFGATSIAITAPAARTTTSTILSAVAAAGSRSRKSEEMEVDSEGSAYPFDSAIATLPKLRLLHLSGALASSAIFSNAETTLDHFLVANCAAFEPPTLWSALDSFSKVSAGMRVTRLSLPLSADNQEEERWDEGWRKKVKDVASRKGIWIDAIDDGDETRCASDDTADEDEDDEDDDDGQEDGDD